MARTSIPSAGPSAGRHSDDRFLRPIPAGRAPIAPPPVVVALAIVAIVAVLFVFVAIGLLG